MIPKSRPSRGEERGGGSGYRCWSAAAFSFFSASRPFLWAEKSRPSASLACSGAAARALRCRERRCYRAMVPIPPNGPSPPLSLSLSTLSLSPFATFNSTDPFSQTDRPFSLSLSLDSLFLFMEALCSRATTRSIRSPPLLLTSIIANRGEYSSRLGRGVKRRGGIEEEVYTVAEV